MKNELSIIAENNEIDLNSNKDDNAALLTKTLMNIVPGGGILAEIVTAYIPNQRMDRIRRTIEVFELKFSHVAADVQDLKDRLESNVEIVEETLRQAGWASSEERREYLASLLVNSLTDKELHLIQKKKILYILGEVNDAEILMLRMYSLSAAAASEFSQRHPELFGSYNPSLGAPQSAHDKSAIREGYRYKLEEIGLIKPTYLDLKNNEIPKFDDRGRRKPNNFRASNLGRLLLRYIDLGEKQEAKGGDK